MNTTQIKNINRMNRASASPLLGQVIQDLITSASSVTGTIVTTANAQRAIAGASGSVVVDGTQASASRVVIATGLTTVRGFVGQDLRSGSPVTRANWVSGSVAGTIVVMSATAGSPLPLASGDTLSYMAW